MEVAGKAGSLRICYTPTTSQHEDYLQVYFFTRHIHFVEYAGVPNQYFHKNSVPNLSVGTMPCAPGMSSLNLC